MLSNVEAGVILSRAWKNSCVCDENLLAGMKMFRETLTFRETSRKILDINVSAALKINFAPIFCVFVYPSTSWKNHSLRLWFLSLENKYANTQKNL